MSSKVRIAGRRASVLDVAKLANVSAATASRVLSGSDYPVRPSTRTRVVAAAAELDFEPNLLARALVTARTSTIGAIVHDIADPYFGEILRGLEDAARLHGYQLLVCSSDRDAERELEYVRGLIGRRVDALIFAGGGIERRDYAAQLRDLLDRFRERGGSVVVLSPHGYAAPSVRPDNRQAAAQMVSHLVESGHRRIGFASGPTHLRTSRVRLDGYRKGLEAHGIGFDHRLVEPGGFTIDGGAAATAALLGRLPDMTAIFAANDMMAIGALAELRRRGIEVPGGMSVAGFDDIEMARHASPALTTIRIPLYEIGQQGARLSLDLLDGREPASVKIPTQLIVRASTAPPPRGKSR